MQMRTRSYLRGLFSDSRFFSCLLFCHFFDLGSQQISGRLSLDALPLQLGGAKTRRIEPATAAAVDGKVIEVLFIGTAHIVHGHVDAHRFECFCDKLVRHIANLETASGKHVQAPVAVSTNK
jgi:hypothetical protein